MSEPVGRRPVSRWPDGTALQDEVVVEEPLEIRIEGRSLAVVLRTPGHDRELAAGFLYSEGVIDGADDLVALAPLSATANIIDTRLAAGILATPERIAAATRTLYATSSCGVCGKASIERLAVLAPRLPARDPADAAWLAQQPARLREHQHAFSRTGGLHGAGLISLAGEVEVVREDIGRHNAVDKVIGWRLLQDRVPIEDRVLVVSSRAGFEIVQKAVVARIPMVVAVGAASTLAIDLATSMGLHLYGFASETRLVRYA